MTQQTTSNSPREEEGEFSLLDSGSADGLSPFIATLTKAVERAALAYLGLPERDEVRCLLEKDPNTDGQWRLIFHVRGFEAGALALELFASREGERAWIRGLNFSLAYRTLPDGRDPHDVEEMRSFLRSLQNRLRALDGEGKSSEEGTNLQAALEAYLPFLGVKDRMYRQASGDRSGAVAVLRLGFRCNQDCYFCWQDRDWPEPPDDLYKVWLDEFSQRGIMRVSISGGEPTLHPALVNLVEHANHNLKMAVDMQTNAIRLGRPKYLKSLVDAGLRGIFVSYHSADAEVSDLMTRAPRTYGPTVKGIEACLEAGIKVRMNCVVERANHHLLKEHATEIVERFVKPFPDNPVRQVTYSFPSAYFDLDEFRKMVVPLDEIRPYLSKAVRVLKAADVPVTAVGTCGFPLCVLSDDVDTLWWISSDALDEMDISGRNYGPVCESCKMQSHCLGVRHEYLEAWGDRGLKPFETELSQALS